MTGLVRPDQCQVTVMVELSDGTMYKTITSIVIPDAFGPRHNRDSLIRSAVVKLTDTLLDKMNMEFARRFFTTGSKKLK